MLAQRVFYHDHDPWKWVSKLHEPAIGACRSLSGTFLFQCQVCSTERAEPELPKIAVLFPSVGRENLLHLHWVSLCYPSLARSIIQMTCSHHNGQG